MITAVLSNWFMSKVPQNMDRMLQSEFHSRGTPWKGAGVGGAGEGGEGRVGFSFILWSLQLEEDWQLSVDHKPGTESSTFKINNSPKYKPQNSSYHQRKSEGEKESRGKKIESSPLSLRTPLGAGQEFFITQISQKKKSPVWTGIASGLSRLSIWTPFCSLAAPQVNVAWNKGINYQHGTWGFNLPRPLH